MHSFFSSATIFNSLCPPPSVSYGDLPGHSIDPLRHLTLPLFFRSPVLQWGRRKFAFWLAVNGIRHGGMGRRSVRRCHTVLASVCSFEVFVVSVLILRKVKKRCSPSDI
ncbi:hypothetical protein AVEN_26783-1 [Araneus ventricosus]|uniref:Uncharacterized protein n=1 Tax=Araneus ventricosus TaxID=182803 RepID=A0A4Y2D6W2_ARAVE|nr:hypothetical protein AVEN_26783-1 [Araneus ventricosus]